MPLIFSGYLQPPSVPPDPTGDDWRGLPGVQGPVGPTGPAGMAVSATLPTSPAGLAAGSLWRSGNFLCVV